MKPDQYDALEAQVLAALRRAPGPEPSPELDARILARSQRRGGGMFRPSRLTAIAATVLVLAGGGVALRLAQQVDTVPPALQPPAPLAPDSKAAQSAAATDAAAPSAPPAAATDATSAREAARVPATRALDGQGQGQPEGQGVQANRQDAPQAANEREERGEARLARLQETVATTPPAPPAPPPPEVTAPVAAASPMQVAPPAPPAPPAPAVATAPGFTPDPAPAKPALPALESPAGADAGKEASREPVAQSMEAAATAPSADAALVKRDVATTPEDLLGEIRQLIAAGRRDEARAQLTRLRTEYPEFLVPAEIQTLLEGDAPD